MLQGLTEIDMAAARKLVGLSITGENGVEESLTINKKVTQKRCREDETGEKGVELTKKRQRFLSIAYLYEVTKPIKAIINKNRVTNCYAKIQTWHYQ
ncbi:hypothetical protein KSP40_PGU022561 [Platanthera guangdongensis]|uniref:Uncharacterized protein n=1 Tax=Platanthera guangdongensis TaxID=2320717 RepID=A0ABR2M833_9ASPA